MLKTKTGSITLIELETFLKQRLFSEPGMINPEKINCLLKEKNLMIFLHYQQPAMPYSGKLFSLLQSNIDNLLVSSEYQILMYIVVQGKHRTNVNLPNDDPTQLVSSPIALPEYYRDKRPNKANKKPLPVSRPVKLFLAGCSLAGVVLGVYWANRLCFFNSCPLIPQANQIAEKADLIVQYSPNDLEEAELQLRESQKLLNKISRWSPHYPEAKNLTRKYQQEEQNISRFIESQQLQEQATNLTNFPLSTEELQNIESLWKQALDNLESIPQESQLYELASAELPKITTAKQAITSLKTAQEAAELGKVRETVARSFENWQEVAATWRTAIERLEKIPNNSDLLAEPEIKQISALYQSRLKQANERVEKEQLGAQILQQSQQQAQLAESRTNADQWQEAVVHWRQALAKIEEIPAETFAFQEGKKLLSSYQSSLEDAEDKLKIAFNLEQVCTANIRICNYNVKSDVIRVELTPLYQQQILQANYGTPNYDSLLAQAQLANYITGLKTILQSISDETGLSLELYSSQDVLIVSYIPT